MLDQIYGKPSSRWKRTQVLLVILFWVAQSYGSRGSKGTLAKTVNRALRRLTPYQIVIASLVTAYGIKNTDVVLGLQAPEPLARLYARNYYRATWIVTALDAAFATAMPIRPEWIRHIMEVALVPYFLIFANEADEKLRKFRSLCTVEMLRTTWEKTTNPYLRLLTWRDRPPVRIFEKLKLRRPGTSKYTREITVYLFFDGSYTELQQQSRLILDVPGGGFVSMTPAHHEERIRRWCRRTRLPVLSVDYGKAPEYPYPYAIDECFDLYCTLMESEGRVVGMHASRLDVIVTGDSAGANIATGMVLRLIERPHPFRLPVALMYTYPALSFHFTSWMQASDIRVLRQESYTGVPGFLKGKQHLEHVSPLSIVHDEDEETEAEPALPVAPAMDGRIPSIFSRPASSLNLADSLYHATPLTRSNTTPSFRATLAGQPTSAAPASRSTVRKRGSLTLLERVKFFDDDETLVEEDSKVSKPCVLSKSESSVLAGCEDRWDGAEVGGLSGSGNGTPSKDHQESSRVVNTASMMTESNTNMEQGVASSALSADGRGFDRQHASLTNATLEPPNLSEGLASGKDVSPLTPGQKPPRAATPGTRLAMTSRSAFFNDRILSPSMARAMALLYIGPKQAPDLHSDYHISPLFTPAHILAQFPPVYLNCGERDPLVDDTIIFAGKVREAKEKKRSELLAAHHRTDEARTNRTFWNPRLEESELDWTQTRIIEGWSHGYLQMPGIMPEAINVINFISDWILLAFTRYDARLSRISESSKTVSKVSPFLPVKEEDGDDETRTASLSPAGSRNIRRRPNSIAKAHLNPKLFLPSTAATVSAEAFPDSEHTGASNSESEGSAVSRDIARETRTTSTTSFKRKSVLHDSQKWLESLMRSEQQPASPRTTHPFKTLGEHSPSSVKLRLNSVDMGEAVDDENDVLSFNARSSGKQRARSTSIGSAPSEASTESFFGKVAKAMFQPHKSPLDSMRGLDSDNRRRHNSNGDHPRSTSADPPESARDIRRRYSDSSSHPRMSASHDTLLFGRDLDKIRTDSPLSLILPTSNSNRGDASSTPFVDEKDLLRRRGEDAVFGLKFDA